MSELIIPELILLKEVQSILETLRLDYDANKTQEQESILYKLLNGITIEKYDVFTQIKNILLNEKDNPRYFKINLAYNKKQEGVPTAYLSFPNENQISGTIGEGEGWELSDFNNNDTNWNTNYTTRFKANIDLIFTSDNVIEVTILYYLFKSLLGSVVPDLNFKNLYNITINGKGIIANNEIAPGLFIRSLSLSFEYNSKSIAFNNDILIKNYNISLSNIKS